MDEETPKQKTGNVITRHALLFTVALGGVVLIVLIILMRQKSSTANGASTSTAGDSGLTSGWGPGIAENITNIYGQQTTSSGDGSGSGGTSSGPANVPPIAPPAASGAQNVTTNAVFAGSAGRVPPEPAHNPIRLFRTPPQAS